MDDRNTKRDLVLAPSEYAYMQDVTKGIVKTYTGPTVINPTAQERPVVFDPETRQFGACGLEQAVQQIVIAPEGYYVMLKNPSVKDDHPPAGGVYPAPDLRVGRKINITGPCSFALWPGQLADLVKGHVLRSNQYVLARVYNAEEAGRSPSELFIIKGTDVSFYIPPTGIGVVRDETGAWVRDALTLERLEYCILVDQNGKKRYERGPKVVFPEPTEVFVTRDGARKFKAIELNAIQGLHVKVIAPYAEGGRTYKEGDELFITGAETAIYYPREEHALIGDKHFAVAVPAGEGRYVMNRTTGNIRMVRGPAMLLPNPIDEVIVRRVLSDRECATWYPGNAEVLAVNRAMRKIDESGPRPDVKVVSPAASFENVSSSFTKPRAIVVDAKYEGVPGVSVWVGYAVLVVDKQGRRRVEQGPKNLLVEYDETFEVQQLSTGTPKSSDKLVETAFLRVLNNKVSDRCVVETSDHVQVTLGYSMRVSFTGEPTRWFEVENYVKFLCDHVRSVLKGNAKKQTVETFYAQSVDMVRDAILGKPNAEGKRSGMRFEENGMHVTDVEVLDVTIDDEDIAALLGDAQHEAVAANIAVLRAQRGLELTARKEAIARGEADARAETARRVAELEIAATGDRLKVALAGVHAELETAAAQKDAAVARNAVADADHAAQLARTRAAAAVDTEIAAKRQELTIASLKAEVDAAVARFGAAQGGFSEALLALGNAEVLAKVAEAMSVQSFVGGKTLTDVIDKVFAGTPLAGVMDKVKARASATPTNGKPALPAPSKS